MKNAAATKKFKVNDKVFVKANVGAYAYGYVKEVYIETLERANAGKEKLAIYFPEAKQTGYGYFHSDLVATLAEKKAHAKDIYAEGIF